MKQIVFDNAQDVGKTYSKASFLTNLLLVNYWHFYLAFLSFEYKIGTE